LPVFAGNAATNNTNSKLQIIVSLPLVKNLVEKIGGEKVAVTSIVKSSNCAHEYEPNANDLKTAAKCAIFVKIGMNADKWADKLITAILDKKAAIIDCSRNIKPLKIRGIENPHYWLNPENAKISAKNILDGLIKSSPKLANYFTANYEAFIREIDKTAADLKNLIAKLPDKKIVSYSGAFPYLYQYFGFENLATVELVCEQEVSAKDMAAAVKLMKDRKIKVLVGDAAEPKEPESLAKGTNAKMLLLFATTDESGDYIITLRRNIKILVDALK